MRTWLFSGLLLLLGLVPSIQADASFEAVRVNAVKDHSGKGGDPKQKYFRTCLLGLW